MTTKRREIEKLLLNIFYTIGIDTPHNWREILEYVATDVEETAHPIEWHSGDVDIAFRRWIEAQSDNQP
jgi:isopropylmalate/homocitrate/citramalate synthase